MSSIYRTIKRCWNYLRPNNECRVRFTSSTIIQDRERILRQTASPSPFVNYLNELRLISLHDSGKARMTLRDAQELRKYGFIIWSNMSEERKEKYRNLASAWRKTRVRQLLVKQMPTTLEEEALKLLFGPLRESRKRPRPILMCVCKSHTKRKKRLTTVSKRLIVRQNSPIIQEGQLENTPNQFPALEANSQQTESTFHPTVETQEQEQESCNTFNSKQAKRRRIDNSCALAQEPDHHTTN